MDTLELFVPLLKALGVCVVSKICGDVCRDAGQTAIAGVVELAGTVTALVCALPLLTAVWETLRGLL